MASLLIYLNRLLPFAVPGTPLYQDLLHLAVICTALYFAPQVQEWYRRRQSKSDRRLGEENDGDLLVGNNENVHQDDRLNGQGLEPEQYLGLPTENETEAAADRPPPPPFVQDAEEDEDRTAHVGPAGPRNAGTSAERHVGAKKAKSLARRDQRRAYNEFMRSQGEAQRARDAEGAAEREAMLAAERKRRQAAEAALEAKKAKEREERREQERVEREREIRRREMAVSTVKRTLDERKMCDLSNVARQLGDDVDEEWVERILKAAGLLGRNGDRITMVTSVGWAVRVTAQDMAAAYAQALPRASKDKDGKVSYEALGEILQEVLWQGGLSGSE